MRFCWLSYYPSAPLILTHPAPIPGPSQGLRGQTKRAPANNPVKVLATAPLSVARFRTMDASFSMARFSSLGLSLFAARFGNVVIFCSMARFGKMVLCGSWLAFIWWASIVHWLACF
jgi:hypothetical protein